MRGRATYHIRRFTGPEAAGHLYERLGHLHGGGDSRTYAGAVDSLDDAVHFRREP
ncbi:MAG TPA: hypothetical protein VEP50_00445 [bacterium]|nr:hypothetical protein [bacterium]